MSRLQPSNIWDGPAPSLQLLMRPAKVPTAQEAALPHSSSSSSLAAPESSYLRASLHPTSPNPWVARLGSKKKELPRSMGGASAPDQTTTHTYFDSAARLLKSQNQSRRSFPTLLSVFHDHDHDDPKPNHKANQIRSVGMQPPPQPPVVAVLGPTGGRIRARCRAIVGRRTRSAHGHIAFHTRKCLIAKQASNQAAKLGCPTNVRTC